MKTSRVGFSLWNEDDLILAEQLWGNKNVSRYIAAEGVFSQEDIKNRFNLEISNYKKYNVQYYPIFELSTNKFMGCCGLKPYDIEEGIYETGFQLLKEYWNQGYASEVGVAMIKYAFDVVKVNNLYAGHHPNNKASQMVLKKLDFKYFTTKYFAPTKLDHPLYRYLDF